MLIVQGARVLKCKRQQDFVLCSFVLWNVGCGLLFLTQQGLSLTLFVKHGLKFVSNLWYFYIVQHKLDKHLQVI